MILLKLDFAKAYDTVSLSFLFKMLAKIGIPKTFLGMVRILFHEVAALVCLKGGETKAFSIQRGVRQGCPLAPYLFLFIGKAFNAATKTALATGTLNGIMMPGGEKQQIIVQFADDTIYTLEATEPNLRSLTTLLDTFYATTSLQIN
jgi:hypothetical protein